MRTGRLIGWVGVAVSLLLAPQLAWGKTFYIDAVIGNDINGGGQSAPFRTIAKGVANAKAGDTVIVKPGTYMESVESKRDGTSLALITLRSSTVGGAIVRPPAGTNGFFISHNYHVIDGFVVTAAVTGIKCGPHDQGGGPVVGLLVQNNQVYGNSNNGIQFTNGLNGEIAFNTVYQNGLNGINYSGNSALIHDNVVHDNGQFGIYVKDGVGHQVYNNQAYNNASGDIKIEGAAVAQNRVFYVDSVTGNDAYTVDQAQSPATPWKTIKNALLVAEGSDTVVVQPGLYLESVESKRDGTSTNPITIRAAVPGTATIQPPAGLNGFVITHDYHTIEGFVVTGAGTGIQMGPHDAGSGTVSGLVARNNRVSGSGVVGIKFSNAIGGAAMHNVVSNSGKDGIWYSGSNGNIFNNLVYANGLGLAGDYGITLYSGSGHTVTNNTVYGNASGGIRLSSNVVNPVFSTALNNIVVGNPVGIKEPGVGYTGKATLDYNDVYNNGGGTRDYDLTTSAPGPNSISLAPRFVDVAGNDFRLGRVATGQPADSPCIDRGSDTASAVGLAGRTAFTDKYPDTGRVDLGYHGTLLYPTQGTLTVSQLSMTFSPGASSDGFSFSANLKPGAGSDGIQPGVNYAEVDFGSLQLFLPVTGFQQQGAQWLFSGSGPVLSGVFQKLSDGSVNVTLQGGGLSLSSVSPTVSVLVRIGDDFGSVAVKLIGTLQFP